MSPYRQRLYLGNMNNLEDPTLLFEDVIGIFPNVVFSENVKLRVLKQLTDFDDILHLALLHEGLFYIFGEIMKQLSCFLGYKKKPHFACPSVHR